MIKFAIYKTTIEDNKLCFHFYDVRDDYDSAMEVVEQDPFHMAAMPFDDDDEDDSPYYWED